uniref:Uncharacterized protein n=1 Tax=viral metagenome TaxID=1070528 RepID=A0A6C0KPT8_9ZZZZ
MALIGGKRKQNKSLKAWVTFVKKVQKEEKLTYRDAIHRAKVRKDKGEKWMMGGSSPDDESSDSDDDQDMPIMDEDAETPDEDNMLGVVGDNMNSSSYGGKRRRRKTMKRNKSKSRKSRRGRGRSRASRRH